ncbi:N-acyl-D-amino-acid deacylase [Streptosporangium becharense]|uniref:N-acyl-D-amino-acid deacylase n=1 Tax=Streptosporangium becharense TaxID=1816182 RepID=A0A7W9ME24_9ACTN|nr:amidohydrolase family protein [Streptosporangium becharense]MBB2910710.1 N-acyl-D-amino-acid deacylase [Streptosporangium becharense]MBB5817405.1 N-acyl-D-amino-acid deacylase [Streptosporangium becharense]
MHDLLLRDGTVHDGLGGAPQHADVAIADGRVVAVGHGLGPARRVIDVSGLLVSPGFVDPHSHSDTVPFLQEPQPFKLLQGVTTEIVGNCGFSCGPADPEMRGLVPAELASASFPTFGEYLDAAEAAGPSNNLAVLVGHNTLRLAAAGMSSEITPDRLAHMCELAAQSFEAGAVGLSSGLEYVPGAYADLEELVALALVAKRWELPYATHMRSESEGLADALDEAIAVAKRAGVRLQVSHCKASGRAVHGASAMVLDKLAQARRAGVDVRADVYPYLAFGTVLVAVLPPVACEGGEQALLARLADPAERAALRALAESPDTGTGVGFWRELHPSDVQILVHNDPGVEGKRLADFGGDPWEALCDLLRLDPHASGVFHTMHERDLAAFLADPLISIGSDGGPPVGPNHPRTFGSFPTYLGTYVEKEDMPEAIRKVSSAVAAQFGLTGRGWLGPGAIADLCVFDPDTIGHAGTYEQPDVRPTGVEHVFLAGRQVIADGEFTGGRHGRMLRRGAR